ncbi:hypothetical protein [Streptomyces sp. NPDC055681]
MEVEVEAVVDQLFIAMELFGRVHTFAQGMGIAAPPIGIDRAAAAVQPAEPGAPAIVLLNPASSNALRRPKNSTKAASASSTSAASFVAP